MSIIYMKKHGFTLVELLVAVAIIGLIVTISTVSYSKISSGVRDNRRLSDVIQIQQALELYHRDEGFYPAVLTSGQALIGSSTNNVYLAKVPSAPTPSDNNCSSSNEYIYTFISDDNYNLSYCLGSNTSKASGGVHCATQNGISDKVICGIPPFICGSQITVASIGNYTCTPTAPNYDTCTYGTVQIGTQCWMRQNMNVGNVIAGTTAQTNNNTLEKYCYNNTNSNCQNDGALYQWNETMQYSSTELAQGVCPSGWHVPSDAEQNTLDQYLNDTTCDANRGGWDCANAGTKLKAGGTSGFEGVLAGYRYTNGSFYDREGYTFFWSSSISGPDAWYHYLVLNMPTVGRYHVDRAHGFSVRCIKD